MVTQKSLPVLAIKDGAVLRCLGMILSMLKLMMLSLKTVDELPFYLIVYLKILSACSQKNDDPNFSGYKLIGSSNRPSKKGATHLYFIKGTKY